MTPGELWRRGAGCAVLCLASAAGIAAADPGSGEFVVSSTPSNSASNAIATMDSRGEVLVVWLDNGVFGRRFAAGGEPRGDDFQVGIPTRNELGPLAAALDTKGFTVVWGAESSTNGLGPEALVRRFDSQGQPLGDPLEFDRGDTDPAVISDAKGNSVVVTSSDDDGIVGRRFDASGRRFGPPFRVAPRPVYWPQVALTGEGGFAVVWASLTGIFARRYDAHATPLGPAFRLTPKGSQGFGSILASNGHGSFVVAWTSEQGIFARPYGPRGAGPVVQVTPDSSEIAVAVDATGRFLVTWVCCADSQRKILGRFFKATGVPLGPEFQISLPGPADGMGPSAAANPAGDFLVVWQRVQPNGDSALVGRWLPNASLP